MTIPVYTPGPWMVHVEPDYSIHRTPAVYICRGDEPWPDGQLARVNTADEYGSQQANARLIAAAPEGHELIEQLEESFTADGTYQQFLPAMRAYLAKVGAA